MIELTKQRRKRGLSQERLAALLNLNPSTICRWETQSRNRPYRATAARLEAIFAPLTIDELFAPIMTNGDAPKDAAVENSQTAKNERNSS